MANRNCSLSIKEEDSQIEIIGLAEEKLVIDISGDIDFTPLVLKLASLIDEEEEINFNNTVNEELADKSNLVISTIENIFESYNISINEGEKVLEEQRNEINNETQDNVYLPF
jgi:hypothetical protein